jgi:hypothetical protein
MRIGMASSWPANPPVYAAAARRDKLGSGTGPALVEWDARRHDMAPKELQDLLTKFLVDSYGPEPAQKGWERTPQIEYRVSPAGARLVLFDFDGGQSDLHLPIHDDDHLRAS